MKISEKNYLLRSFPMYQNDINIITVPYSIVYITSHVRMSYWGWYSCDVH